MRAWWRDKAARLLQPASSAAVPVKAAIPDPDRGSYVAPSYVPPATANPTPASSPLPRAMPLHELPPGPLFSSTGQ